ncbi:protein kinase domain-containing protein [Nocardia africana]|uniref:Serine/threonine-protein kinase pknK n=1 Tax=Nocardia africana TaxID=134964 RepID=A0A378WYN3_9NOCA|nr:protein kinase [Nocardia africana]MCC3312352.1 protein kinase [Nocardia africana]SUA46338.1 Serine/threonine-protein kinase pknK [Nocardia africana]
MAENDLCKTQRDVGIDVITELRTAGFEDAQEIGRGGFGEVYRCRQIGVERTVAVKVLTEEFDDNRERFLREQRAMGRLTGHPNIVDMLEVGATDNGHPYLVMPYHSHGSLHDRILRDGPLPLPEILHIGVMIAGALETAHRAGVLHRDIKPANILLTDYGEPALTDFGIAHITGGFETATGTVTGSPAFTAPEVLRGEAPSEASDVYGLGSTLFCALTGHAAYERRAGEQVVAQFLRITEQPIPDLRDNGIPDDVARVIEEAMSHDPAQRPTAAVFGDRLRQVQRGHGLLVDRMPLRDELEAPLSRWATSAPTAAGEGNLPPELTSFVGRRVQVAEVKNLLAMSRLVTLTGIGGVGKSRLALRVAHKLKDEFADGVWLVELGDTRDPTLLVDVVANALGLRSRGAGPILDVLIGYLSTRELLVVLDNCEQVIDAATALTESLLRTCPGVRILATSREPLDVGGESVFAVPPLTIPDPVAEPAPRVVHDNAVALFAERGAAVVPGFEVTEDNRADVTRICARLDGLPLAIELAAARLRAMSPQQILSGLDDRYGLLTRGRRGAPMRQQTLAWCIGWSYDLCTPDEQRLWARLSVFAGGFELDAVEQVCGDGPTRPQLLDALSVLVDKSILIREDVDHTVRFRMLETVQEYGRHEAEESGEYVDFARRHRDWCLALAQHAEREWIGPQQLRWVARLERELPNLRTALEFAVSESTDVAIRMVIALHLFWMMRGRLDEGRRWTARALTHAGAASAVDRAKALYTAGSLAVIQRDFGDATDKVTQLEHLAEQTDSPVVDAILAHARGAMVLMTSDGDLDRAHHLMTEAIDRYEEFGELSLRLDALISLGWSCALLGATSLATECFEQVVAITEAAGETMLRSWALWGEGYVAWRGGEPDRATRLLEDGIRSARLVPDPLVSAACTETLAWVVCEHHDHRRAAVLMGAADSLVSVAGSAAFVFPDLLTHRTDCVRDSREALGERAFETALGEGAAMTFDSAVAFALREQSEVRTPRRGVGTLTKREIQVAELVAQGLSNKAIAARLVISQRTAEGHVEHILAKLGFTSRLQIATWVAAHPEF